MRGFPWRSLRSDVRQHLAFLPECGYAQVRAERGGVFDHAGCIVLRRDEVRVMVARHMGQDFIDLAFVEAASPLDWFNLAYVVSALGSGTHSGDAPIVHTLAAKAPILKKLLPLIEAAAHADRDGLVRRVAAARDRAVSQNDVTMRNASPRRSASS